MADRDPKGDNEESLAQTTSSKEVQRGTKRPVSELDQDDNILQPTPAKLHVKEQAPESDTGSTSETSDSKATPHGSDGSSSESGNHQPSSPDNTPEIPPSKPGQLQYRLVSKESEIQPAMAKLRERSEEHPFLAVDCEGEKLSRRGKLSVVSVATYSYTYLFDIIALGAKVFEEGLKELLEDPTREKLMFDCRSDSDCLWHLYKVRLSNVVDLQLLQVIVSYDTVTCRSHVNGYRKCLALYVDDRKLVRIKEEGTRLMGEGGTEWMKRPLNEKLLKYAVVDVQGFFLVYDKLKPVLEKAGAKTRLQLGSQRYLDLYRGKSYRTYDKYEHNSYVPRRILHETSYRQQRTCQGCQRSFPRYDLKPNKCSVCMTIDGDGSL